MTDALPAFMPGGVDQRPPVPGKGTDQKVG